MKRLGKILKFVFLIGGVVFLLLLSLNFWVIKSTENQIFHEIENIPKNKVALILGTSKRTTEGEANKYFVERIDAAAKLYHHGKVDHIIVSGDNRTVYYNEPRDMYNALVERKVPKGAITLDFAGLRTLDSIVRSDSIFGQKDITIVTQDFHCYRSLFIANYYGIKAVAYSADNKSPLPIHLAVREVVARLLAVFDLYVWNQNPTVMGDQEFIDL
jgi:SanA protein